jgi:hypothetical protein
MALVLLDEIERHCRTSAGLLAGKLKMHKLFLS